MVGPDGELKEPLEIGKLTYVRRGCNACHSIDGKHGTGPTFAGLWGIERRFDAAGDQKRVADEDYIRQSITDPHSQLVYPYGKNMAIYDPMLPETRERLEAAKQRSGYSGGSKAPAAPGGASSGTPPSLALQLRQAGC